MHLCVPRDWQKTEQFSSNALKYIMSDMQNHKNSFKYNKKITKKLRKCTFEHFM